MQLTPRFSPSQGLKHVSRRMSLELKLPLLMSIVLAVVLGTVLVATYTSLRRAAVARSTERLERATRQLVAASGAGLPALHARFAPIADDSTVHRALRTPAGGTPPEAVRSVLERLVLATDSGLPVELWSADGRRLAFVGHDVRGTVQVERGRPELPLPRASTMLPMSATDDSLRIGPLYGDSSGVYYWFVMPVRERQRSIGYVAQQRKLAMGANATRTIRELSGDSVSLYYRNLDQTFWASGNGLPAKPLSDVDSVEGTARDVSGEVVYYREGRVGSSPIVIGMSVSPRGVMARTKRSFGTILGLTLLLMAGGVVASWLIGRSVARPLGNITRAAGSLAAGDYDARVPPGGDLEISRLADTFNHMAEEIGRSRRELERQTHEARAANSAKSEFLTTMSHELRTPLNAIGGYVDLLAMELRGPLTDAQRRDLERVKVSQQHLLGLISSVLDLSRIEAGRVTYDITHVAVEPFLSGLDTLVAPQASAKSITLRNRHGPADLTVMADREKLRQVMLNLLSNAIRHTPTGGSVTISAEPRGGRVALVVEDTGPGIPPDKREEIFEPFVQLDRSLTQTVEGLGLGLAISRDLARGMSGDLVVESDNGTGARFVVTLPAGRIESASAAAMSDEWPAARKA